MNQKEYLREKLEPLQIPVDDIKLEQLVHFFERLVEKNKVMNLTAITEFPDVVEKHFLDSLMFQPEDTKAYLIDVGTGAGFPGIPLKIIYPQLHVTLVDSLKKRLSFLQETADMLGVTDIQMVHARAEDLGRNSEYREKYDYCVSRAVANLATLSEYCLPFVRVGGYFVSYKSGKIQEELEAARRAWHLLSAEQERTEQFVIPGTQLERSLIWIRKSAPMSSKYPRKAGVPAREPLGVQRRS